MKNKVYTVLILLVVVVSFVFINAFVKSRQEYIKKYDFVITNIESDAKGDLTFYDSFNRKYFFASYRFNEFNKLGISVGDRFLKDSFSKNINVSRKIKNKYAVYYVQKPNGMIPFFLYSY